MYQVVTMGFFHSVSCVKKFTYISLELFRCISILTREKRSNNNYGKFARNIRKSGEN